MLNLFTEEHTQLLSALIKNKVDFMLVGGYAVIHYGFPNKNFQNKLLYCYGKSQKKVIKFIWEVYK